MALALWNDQYDWIRYLAWEIIGTKLKNSEKVCNHIISEKKSN